jgi:hypothetical protein
MLVSIVRAGMLKSTKYYGLFLTYPLMNATTDSLSILSQTNNVPSS